MAETLNAVRAGIGGTSAPRRGLAWAINWRGSALAAVGLLLTFAAPLQRTDLLLIGLALLAAGLVWEPLAGPLLIGLALPFFFFDRPLGSLSVSPPGLALMLSWLAALGYGARGRLRLRWPRTDYAAPLALLLLATALSFLVTEYPLLSVRALRALIIEPVLFFWLLRVVPSSSRLALAGFLISAALTALIASGQVLLGLGGTAAEGVVRAQAWYPSPNHLALMLGRAWPFLLAAALAAAARPRWAGLLVWLAAAVVGLGLLLTFSTGGWVGGAAAALVVIGVLVDRRWALRLGGLAIVALVLSSGLAIIGRLPERLDPLRQTGGFRLDLWLSSIQMVRDHPLLGIGLDNFAYLYQQVYLREGAAAEPNLSHPHNWILNFWLELGLLGLIAFVWLVVRFVGAARQRLRAPSAWLVAGALGAMADLLLHGFIDNSYFLADLAFVFWLSLALVTEPDSFTIDGT